MLGRAPGYVRAKPETSFWQGATIIIPIASGAMLMGLIDLGILPGEPTDANLGGNCTIPLQLTLRGRSQRESPFVVAFPPVTTLVGLVSPNQVYGEPACLVVEVVTDQQAAPRREQMDQQASVEREPTASVHPRGKVKRVKNAQAPAPPWLTDQARVILSQVKTGRIIAATPKSRAVGHVTDQRHAKRSLCRFLIMMKHETIPIADICVPTKRRATLEQKRVDEIAASIADKGLQAPILVRADGVRFVLVDGLHRLDAGKALGNALP